MKINKKLMLVIIFLLLALIITSIIDLITETEPLFEKILGLSELVFSSGVAMTISISFTFSKTNHISANNNSNAQGDNTLKFTTKNDAGTTLVAPVIGNQGHYDVHLHSTSKEVIEVMRDMTDAIDKIKKENTESIIEKVSENMKAKAVTQSITPDFMLSYMENSSLISNKDIQDIWAKLLVHNITTESISKRTLDIVKNMTSEEAKKFQRVASFSLEDGSIPKSLTNNTLSFEEISSIKDIGLLKNESFCSETITINPNQTLVPKRNHKIGLIIKNNNQTDTLKISYECDVLSKPGMELKRALEINISDQDFISFCKQLKNKNQGKNITIEARKIKNISQNQILFDQNNLI